MRSKAKRAVGIAVACATAMSVAACGGSSSSSSGGSSKSLLTGKSPTGVTLTLWHDTADTPALDAMYKAYEKESGNKLDILNVPASTFGFVIQSKWATGARPDILEWQGNDADARSLNMAQNGIDLSSLPFVKKEGSLAKLSGNVDGKVYAATLGPLLVYGLYYNKKDFAKAGLSAPKDYADIANDCKVLKSKEPGVTPIYEAGGSSFPPQALASFLYTAQYNVNASYADAIVNGKQKLDSASGPFVAGLKAYDALKSAGCFNSDAATQTWASQTKAVLDGTAAMMAEDTNSIAQLDSQAGGASKADAALAFVPVSATKPVAADSANPPGTYYVPKTGNTTKEKAAIGFIKWITSPAEYQKYVNAGGTVPTLSGTKAPSNMQALWKDAAAMTKGAGLALNSAIPGFGNNFGNESDALLAGQQTPQVVASKMQAFVEEAEKTISKG